LAVPFRLNIPSHCPEIYYLESVQEVMNYISGCLRGVADELSALRCPTAWSANGADELSGRILFKDVRSFSDSYGQIIREAFLHVGSAALGTSLAMLAVGLVRKEILKSLMDALPSGSVREEGVLLIVEMNDGMLRLKPVLERARSVIHVRAKYTPAFYAGV